MRKLRTNKIKLKEMTEKIRSVFSLLHIDKLLLIIMILVINLIGNLTFANTKEKTVNVKYFFPKNGTQNPDGTIPNWYYYWGQEEPATTTRNYSSSWIGPNSWAAMWSLYPTTGISEITVFRIMSTGFHYCTSKMAHENKHESDFRNVVWAGGFDSSKDVDNDGLRDSWEVANPGAVPNHPSASDWSDFNSNWFDPRAYVVENNYPNNSATKDWASPGTNW